MENDIRPWGQYWVLEDAETHKIKRILVSPGGRLSLQYHKYRAEVWTIIEGNPIVTIDGQEISCFPGQTIIIPLGAVHRIENQTPNNVLFIEVQHGTYFGEDDIVRIEDDYKRI